ncbi:MAG: hypothetical protein HY259_14575 [Chloroflexi bacterium]|nr:hypothetical protein [Chloroflexota bacterium]MBI3734660.1 hypothetical protein [Chloroflexota bacterium]
MMADWLALSPRRLLAALGFIAIFVLATQPVTDPDLWWHLRTGQWIAEQGAVPRADPFSFTKSGEPWVAHEWLADLTLFTLWRAGGMNALVIVAALVVTAAFAVVYSLSELRPHLAVFTTLLAALASAVTWGPRPQMLTLLFAALILLIVQRARAAGPRRLYLLLPLILLWANAHSGFFLGLILIGATLVGDIIELLLRRRSLSPDAFAGQAQYLKHLTAALVLATLIAAINPNGPALLIYPFFTLTSRAMQTYIVEWHSPDFHDPRFLPFALLLLSLLTSFALSSRRPTLGDMLLLLGLGYESLVSARNIPFFALVAAPVITKQVSALMPHAPQPVTGHSTAPTVPKRRLVVLNRLVLAVAVLVAVARVGMTLTADAAAVEQNFPAGAAAYLEQHHLPGPMLNSYNFGGYLIWRLFPAYKVFIDGRADVYGDRFMDEYYARAWQGRGDWQGYLDRYQIALVLMEQDGALTSLLRGQPQWRLVYEDKVAAIFQRAP